MNYYERHIGDYLKDTAHLSLLEHGVYGRLLDVYYSREGAIPVDQAERLVGARSKDERAALAVVLDEFFRVADGALRHDRCERELERYRDKQRKASASANARWSKQHEHTERNADAMRTHSEGNAEAMLPVTSNQTPDPIQTPRTETGGVPPSSAPVALPDLSGHEPTAAGLLCRAIKSAGVFDVNPGHPDLLRLMACSIPAETWTSTAEELAGKGKGKFALLLKTVEGRWNDAQAAPALAQAAAALPGVAAVAQTAALLAEQAEAGRRANSPEAQAARIAAMARLRGVAA